METNTYYYAGIDIGSTTVKLVLLASNNTAPSETLIDEVQTAGDPTAHTRRRHWRR